MKPSTDNSQIPEPAKKERPVGVRRGAYLLPSVITVGNLILGFYALVLGLDGRFQQAVLLIFFAAFIDGLDGRLARRLQSESDFGREYDSLADVVTFGTVPPVLLHQWTLSELQRVGWAVPAFFLVCAATRLARFNVITAAADKRWFAGLPVPAAAGCLGSLLYFGVEIDASTRFPVLVVQLVLLVATLILGLLMVSGFRYYSFKELNPRRRWTSRIALPIAALGLIALLQPAGFFLVGSTSYALWGPALWLRGRLKRPATTHEPQDATNTDTMPAANEETL